MIILLAVSHEIQTMRVNKTFKEALAQLNKGAEMRPLPKKFALKLTTEMDATPAEFADALIDENERPNWELRLKEIKKKEQGKLLLTYIGNTTPHEVSYDFEIIAQKVGSNLNSFMVHEETTLSQGL